MEASIKKEKHKKTPLLHVLKKTDTSFGKKFFIKFSAILLAFIVSSIFLALSTGIDTITFISKLFAGTFGNYKTFVAGLKDLAILLGLSLALLPAFKMKFWNTGADGQALMGAISAYLILLAMPDSGAIKYIIAFFAALAGGIIWGVIPALFKAFFKTNETLFTLMMNYIAIQFVAFISNIDGINKNGYLLQQGTWEFANQQLKYIVVFLMVIFIFALISFYIKKTKHGYELSLVGESENTAKYAGINVKWVIIRTMILSGAICGFIGFILATGLDGTVSGTTLGGRGFTAIIIVWLANFNPAYMFLASFFIIFLTNGAGRLPTTNASITNVIIGIFLLFIIGCTFFTNYRIAARKNDDGEIDNKVLRPIVKWYLKCEAAVSKFTNKVSSFFKNKYNVIVSKFKKDDNIKVETYAVDEIVSDTPIKETKLEVEENKADISNDNEKEATESAEYKEENKTNEEVEK